MFPYQEMMQLLCSAITERCKAEMNIEVPDKIPEKLGNPEEVAFFEGGKAEFDTEDVEGIARYKATIFNSDIEKFLDCPESWAKEKADTILGYDKVKQNFVRVMKCRTEAAAIAQIFHSFTTREIGNGLSWPIPDIPGILCGAGRCQSHHPGPRPLS